MAKFKRAAERCPRCGRPTLVEDKQTGELVCSNCGFVVKDKIERTEPEWRTFPDEKGEDNSRAGLPTSVAQFDMGLSTVIGRSNKDSSGSSLSGLGRSTVERMRVWDRRSQAHGSQDSNLKRAFAELRTFAEKISVGEDVVERAAYIYRKALERGLLRGRSITSIAAASLYAATRNMGIPRSLKEVSAASNVNRKDLARSYRLLLKELDIRMPVVDAAKSVSKIASRAGLSEKTKRRAIELLSKAKEAEVSAGKDPMGLAAAALYVASTLESENKTQGDLADAAQVTEVTIRNRYKGLRASLKI